MKLLYPPPLMTPTVGQGNVRGEEEEHPAPRHRPVRQEPVVHKAVDHPQQHRYGQVLDVAWVPEAWPVGQQEDTDQPDEPPTPDRDPCRIQEYVRGRSRRLA